MDQRGRSQNRHLPRAREDGNPNTRRGPSGRIQHQPRRGFSQGTVRGRGKQTAALFRNHIDPFESDEEDNSGPAIKRRVDKSMENLSSRFNSLGIPNRSLSLQRLDNAQAGPSGHNKRGNMSHNPRRGNFNRHDNRQRANSRPDGHEERHIQHNRDTGNNRKRNADDGTTPEGKMFSKRRFPLSFKKLEEMLTLSPENVVLQLMENHDAFLILLDKPDLSPDCICLILRAVVIISDCYFEQQKLKIIHMVVEDCFLNQLLLFVTQIHIQGDADKRRAGYFWKDPAKFFLDLYTYCETILKSIPSIAINVLPKLIKAVRFELPALNLGNDLCKQYENFEVALNQKIENFHQYHQKKEINADDPEEEPPEDFRTIPIFPAIEEIITDDKPFLRANIVNGRYRNVEHYLDIQYRLVRNDFVKPLRDGICTYLDPDSTKKAQNIKIYNDVVFLRSEMCDSKNGYLIQLPRPKKKFQLKLENSRLFMYGSLVCFTSNKFKTIVFGRIADRKIELLKEHRLIVSLHFDDQFNHSHIDFNANYMMIECKVYFEPYYYVLKALQELNEDDFPMKPYIIDIETQPAVPEYYGEMLNEAGKYRIPIVRGVLHEHFWPSMEALKLNEAQYRAYKNALSNKFSIIQGPPGTGKTHLGLEVGRALLHNRNRWHNGGHPMMVICYTNHALDQFLEGLLTTTNEIVRIGGQSRNKNLDQYNLRCLRKKSHNRLISANFTSTKRSAENLKRYYDILECIRSFAGVVNVLPIIKELRLDSGPMANMTASQFLNWLLSGKTKSFDQENIEDMIAVQNALKGQMPSEIDENTDSKEDEEIFDDLFRMAQEEQEFDVDDEIFHFDCTKVSNYIVTLKSYEDDILRINKEADELSKMDADLVDPREVIRLQAKYNDLKSDYDYLNEMLNHGRNMPRQFQVPERLLQQLEFSQYIPPNDRWALYFYWLRIYEKHVLKQMTRAETVYQNALREFEDVKHMIDIEMLKSKLVIGMTTTGAARLQSVLKALRSRVVIIEEAAEIMEAHIITALTRHCQHVILIGDHQQLRPSTADYVMETRYNLGISLFERMIRNNVHCNTLEIQHRMRPEFAKLIVPTIYPVLHNHQSVHNFPRIKGVQKNLYFINHTNAESIEKDDSKLNMFEVKYLIRLAQYLILNGYEPCDITILCAYSAQFFKMFNARKGFPMLRDIRICVLDNYQGEESKIILLSLVRNNTQGAVGFLKIPNRICVALSRAREGFYIMGNMKMLTTASPDVWGNINQTLQEQSSIGEALPLQCEIHRENITLVSKIDDFQKVVEGGCELLCGTLLKCGHLCKMQCHIQNRDHATSNCRERCVKLLCERDHQCPKMCFETCEPCMVPVSRTLRCGHTNLFPCSDTVLQCRDLVQATLQCDHVTQKPCFLAIDKVICPHPCDVRVDDCGHQCVRRCHVNDDPDHLEYKCHKKCERYRPGCMQQIDDHRCRKLCYEECENCDIAVKKTRSCGHVYTIPCADSVESLECSKPCKIKLDCGHPCKQKCYEPCGNCNVPVEKVVPECGHKIKTQCKITPTKAICNRQCTIQLACGHMCQNKCKEMCTKKCTALTKSIVPLLCRHYADIPCSMNNSDEINVNVSLLNYCREPCNTELKCGHQCSGNCGECFQGRIHKACGSNCGVTLVCGHVCKTPCRAECPPCNQNCEVRCPHNKCGKKCGDVCTPCRERCARKCKHRECTNKCEDICSVGPCIEPCEKILKCGHPCIGFCGDPCPPLCRICDEEVTEPFLGYEDEIDARFVLLEECGHVIESQGMDMWMNQKQGAIAGKFCPKCKTPLIKTRRYSDDIKELMQDVMLVKKKIVGDLKKNIEDGANEITKLNELCQRTGLTKEFPMVKLLQEALETQLKPVTRFKRKMLSRLTVSATTAKIQILQNICNLYDNIYKYESPTTKCKEYIDYLLKRLITDMERMTQQEVEDYEIELKRLRRIIHFDYISIKIPTYTRKLPNFVNMDAELYHLGPYKIENDGEVKKKLDELQRYCGSLFSVTEAELKDIIKAVGVRSGAWYKCPNGHPYAIGDCGGAMQLANCADCGAKIGGQNHGLTSGNTHTNMDGSQYAAWSEQANMANYQF